MAEEIHKVELDYQSPPPPRPSVRERLRRWRSRYPGPDSFLGCAALFFSLLPALALFAGWAVGGAAAGACFGVPVALVAAVLGLAGLLERETSKTFPVTALLLAGAYLLAVLVVAPRLGG